MRTGCFIFCLFLLFSVRTVCAIEYRSGISSEGFHVGMTAEEWLFRFEMDVRRDADQWKVDSFAFETPRVSFGPISTEGLGKVMEAGRTTPADPGVDSFAAVNREADPLSNLGIILSSGSQRTGLAGWRSGDLSHVLFWSSPPILSAGKLSFGQSVSIRESVSDDDSWYFDDIPLQSTLFANSLVSLVLGRGQSYCGGILQISLAESDRGGMSFTALSGADFAFLQLKGEASWISPGFVFADCQNSGDDFQAKTRFVCTGIPFLLEGEADLSHGQDNLNCDLSVKAGLNREIRSLKGEAEVSIGRENLQSPDPSVTLSGTYRRNRDFLWWQAGAKGGYDDSVYSYKFSLGGGADTGLYAGEVGTSLEIDRRIRLNGKIEFSRKTEDLTLTARFSLEDIGLYNCADVEINPAFEIEAVIGRNTHYRHGD